MKCIHCGTFVNTHCRCSKTCPSCGKPLSRKVEYIDITLDKANLNKTWEMRCSKSFGWQSMFHHERAISMNGSPLKHDGEQVFADFDLKCYIIL